MGAWVSLPPSQGLPVLDPSYLSSDVLPASQAQVGSTLTVPKELVEVSMLHILKDHDEWVALHTDAIELDNVLMLEIGQQLSFTVKVLAGIVTGILQRLGKGDIKEKLFQ